VAVVIALHQIEITVQQGNLSLQILFFAQGQVTKVKNGVTWPDEVVPVFQDQVLSASRPAAIVSDIGIKEMGIRDQPGAIVKRKVGRVGRHGCHSSSHRWDIPDHHLGILVVTNRLPIV
jgi:hypothetical protein